MDDFIRNFIEGFYHVLDLRAYDHILFVILLAIPFIFKNWKPLLWLVTSFTVGHSISLLLSIYGSVRMNSAHIEFLIPATIIIVALYNILTSHKNRKDGSLWISVALAGFFGLIHGFGFASGFRMLASGGENKLLLLLEFGLGIEAAQLVIVFFVLILTFIFTSLIRFNRKEWVQLVSAIILGMAIPMLINRWIF